MKKLLGKVGSNILGRAGDGLYAGYSVLNFGARKCRTFGRKKSALSSLFDKADNLRAKKGRVNWRF